VQPAACDWRLPEPSDLQIAVLDVVGSRPIAAPGTAAGSVVTGIRS
jgi:hypothetical protein